MQRPLKEKEKNASFRAYTRIEAEIQPHESVMRICGVKAVGDYSDTQIILSVRNGEVILTGFRLMLAVFDDHTVEISGKIRAISFN